ncbi:UNVERIFIED_CONTAM: hypothetical protein FKN15_018842 [Acipenser sinensis]
MEVTVEVEVKVKVEVEVEEVKMEVEVKVEMKIEVKVKVKVEVEEVKKQVSECTVNEGQFTKVKTKKSAAGLPDSVLERNSSWEVTEPDTASSSKVVERGGDLQALLADGPESGPVAVLTCPEEKGESSLTAELPVPDSAEGMKQIVAAERSGEELKQVGMSEVEENEEMFETEDGELSDSYFF